jgi:hypothetical protein
MRSCSYLAQSGFSYIAVSNIDENVRIVILKIALRFSPFDTRLNVISNKAAQDFF